MKTQIVSFHCTLKNKFGKVLGKTFNHEVINRSESEDAPLSGLVDGMQNLKKGEKRSIYVPAEKAYGLYDPRLAIELPRKAFPKELDIHIGNEIVYPDFEGKPRNFRVIQVTKKELMLDANHALAGQDLIFDIEATEAREEILKEESDYISEKHGFLH
jgi:FKBP-type peptidyl-prolyl cis-trans isomerase SlyD